MITACKCGRRQRESLKLLDYTTDTEPILRWIGESLHSTTHQAVMQIPALRVTTVTRLATMRNVPSSEGRRDVCRVTSGLTGCASRQSAFGPSTEFSSTAPVFASTPTSWVTPAEFLTSNE